MVKQTKSTNSQNNIVKQTLTGPVTEEYVAVIPMTFEERYKMYMRCKKEELAKMLAQRDEYEFKFPQQFPYYPAYPSYPTYPSPIGPYYEYPHITCDANTSVSVKDECVSVSM